MDGRSSAAALAATGLTGALTGALAFVSAVDVRTLLNLAEAGEEDLIRKLFPVWWPAGRDLMVPLLVVSSATSIVAWSQTSNKSFLASAALVGALGPYTAIVLGEDIQSLRKADTKEVASITRRFCALHHPRLVAAAAACGFCLLGLSRK